MQLQFAVGDTLRKLRLERHLTMRQVSDIKYISIGHLSEVERGKKQASYQTLDLLADCFDMKTSDLIKEIYEYLEEHERAH
jgi:transcriptional regulator with XRE-family HTH domain